MDVRRLNVLRQLHDRGTIAATAEALHLTPSAVSQQLAVLSREVGAPLLRRQGRGVRLTPQAHVLLEHATAVQAQIERARADLAAYDEGRAGSVTVGAFASAITGLVAPALPSLHAERPYLAVSIHEADAPHCFTLLDNSELDVVITVDYPGGPTRRDPRYHRTDLLFDRFDAALHVAHPLAVRPEVHLCELARQRWIIGGGGGPCAEVSLAACAAAGFTPDVGHRVDEWNAALALVDAGAGVTLVPRLAHPRPFSRVCLRPLAGEPPRRSVYAATRAGAQHDPSIAPLLDALATVADRQARAAVL